MKRENNIDGLRVLACFMVIIIHLASDYIVDYMEIGGSYFTWANIYDSMCRVAVPLFVIISGRYALWDQGNIDYKKYYKKVWKKIYIPTLIWSVVYFGFFYLQIYIKGGKNWWLPVKAFYEGAPYYHMWYLYMCIGLYLLTPFLIRLRLKIGEENFRKLGYTFLIFGIILVATQELLIKIRFYERDDMLRYLKYFWYFNYFRFLNYIGYFILGYSLKDVKVSRNWGLAGAFLSLGSMCVAMQYTKSVIVYNYNLPFVVGGAFFLYFTFNNLKFGYNFKNLAGHTFNIYLVHAMIITVLTFVIRWLFGIYPSPVWFIPLGGGFVFIASLLFSIGLEKILRYIK